MRNLIIILILTLGACGVDTSDSEAERADDAGVDAGVAPTDAQAISWACQNAGRWRVDVEDWSGTFPTRNRSAYVNVQGGSVFVAKVVDIGTGVSSHPNVTTSLTMLGGVTCVVSMTWDNYRVQFYPRDGSNAAAGHGWVDGDDASIEVEGARQI